MHKGVLVALSVGGRGIQQSFIWKGSALKSSNPLTFDP